MFRVQFTDFRSFRRSSAIEIRPLTLLVGENSAGKTSFLAGVRFALESLSRRVQNPFNRDPYYLGGFDQIAHYRGGRGGRARSFAIALETANKKSPAALNPLEQSFTRHEFKYERGFPQPELSNYTFSSGDLKISFSVSGDEPIITITQRGKSRTLQKSKDMRGPPSQLIRENSAYIRYLMDDILFRRHFRQSGEESAQGSSLDEEFDLHKLRRIFLESAESLSQTVFATAPVRTQPLRTYTPSEVLASSEGSHVPLEMARVKQKSQEAWVQIKNALQVFGKKSGLFDEIEVRQLGKKDTDPFQILVKVNGPSMNLVDVGYGVSQALPIIYQMQNSRQHNVFLLQQPEVHLHPRAQAEMASFFVQIIRRKSKPTIVVETHSDYIINRIRIELAKKNISADDVTIVFLSKINNDSKAFNLYFDETGQFINTPPEYREFFLQEHARLLGV